jgi:DNA polymerase-1
VTFDVKAPTFRHEMYEGYKATRKGMPEELAQQLPWLQQVIDALRIPRFALAGWEADDLLGTISERCEAQGWNCLLVTGDRDSLQLIGERTHVMLITTKPGKNEYTEYDEALFWEKYGFAPLRLIDLKALMGDASDNIPGVRGVGEKTAMELMHRFGSLEGVYGNLEGPSMKPALRKKLEEGRAMAELSFRLAAILRTAPLDFDPESCRLQEPDNDALYALFERLEFRKLIEAYGLHAPDAAPSAPAPEESKVDWTEAPEETVLEACRSCGTVFFAWAEDRSSLALIAGEQGYSLPAPEDGFLRAFFGPEIPKASTELKALMGDLSRLGLPREGLVFDAALAAYLLDPSDGSYTLPRITKKLLGQALPEERAEGLEALPLLRSRAEAIRAIYARVMPLLKEQGMLTLFEDIELPLCPVLADMESRGFPVDREALLRFGASLGVEIDTLQKEICALAGEDFNINSTKKLGEILFDKLGLPSYGKTKTGHSTNIEVLEKLVGKHPIVEKIIDYRKLTKLKSTYADALLRYIGPDGRIHTTLNMTVTATGRLSSADPNLQNIPVRTELGGEVRRMFVASPGCVLVDADYSQIELRILSCLAEDRVMQQAFLDGEDIHRATASQVFGVPPEDVTPLMRSRAKAVNFGIVYGISDYSLSQDIHVTRSEARAYMDSYLAHYSGVRQYMADVVARAKEKGYAETLFGRRRYLPELKSSNFNLRSFGERVAMNMPVQGTAADIIKLAMIRVADRLAREVPEARLLLQVHDELIAECPEALGEQVAAILTEEMQGASDLPVPLIAEAHTGKTWYDAK